MGNVGMMSVAVVADAVSCGGGGGGVTNDVGDGNWCSNVDRTAVVAGGPAIVDGIVMAEGMETTGTLSTTVVGGRDGSSFDTAVEMAVAGGDSCVPIRSVSLPVSIAMQSLSLRGRRFTLGDGVCGGCRATLAVFEDCDAFEGAGETS